MPDTSASVDQSQHRIPRALQDVFVASNKGKEVHNPPAEGLASRVYLRNWVHNQTPDSPKRPNKKSAHRRSLFGESEEKIQMFANNIPEIEKTTGSPLRRARKRPSFKESATISPQAILDEQMFARSYSTDTYKTLHTAYYSPPSELQRASYGPHMVRLVKEGNAEGLKEALDAGLSPNPCNAYGESLVHMVCRRGDMACLKVLLDAGAGVQVADDYGRTPLHDACWSANPAFEVVKALLERDNRMFYLKDCRGALPLSYVHRDHFQEWDDFLGNATTMDEFFPLDKATGNEAPALCKLWPNARPLPDPKNALPVELAQMVSNGKLTPEEARIMDDATVAEDTDSEDEYDSELDSDEENEEDDEDEEEDDDDEDDSEYEVDEEILQLAQLRMS